MHISIFKKTSRRDRVFDLEARAENVEKVTPYVTDGSLDRSSSRRLRYDFVEEMRRLGITATEVGY